MSMTMERVIGPAIGLLVGLGAWGVDEHFTGSVAKRPASVAHVGVAEAADPDAKAARCVKQCVDDGTVTSTRPADEIFEEMCGGPCEPGWWPTAEKFCAAACRGEP